ncbi:MAG: HAD family phosphatase [Firmicutes bacterium]|nr:HAD family phosphatase [Bacillota bacterium]
MNIVFDIGNVLLSFRPREYLMDLFGDSEMVDLYHKMVFGSSLWLDLDRGVTDEAEVILRLSACHPEHTLEIKQVFANWYSLLRPIEITVNLLYELKAKGHRLYALSNFHREAFDHVREQYQWLRLFDGMVISYEINSHKPEPKIYQTLIHRYGLNPHQSVFIDDITMNLTAAEEFGFKTIKCTSPEALARDLSQLLAETTDI